MNATRLFRTIFIKQKSVFRLSSGRISDSSELNKGSNVQFENASKFERLAEPNKLRPNDAKVKLEWSVEKAKELESDISTIEKKLISLLITESSNGKNEISNKDKLPFVNEDKLGSDLSAIERKLMKLLYAESSNEKTEINDEVKDLIKEHKMLLRLLLHYQSMPSTNWKFTSSDFSFWIQCGIIGLLLGQTFY